MHLGVLRYELKTLLLLLQTIILWYAMAYTCTTTQVMS